MDERPPLDPSNPETAAAQRNGKEFAKRVGRVLLASLAGSVLYALVIGPRNLAGFSNGLFIVGAILLIIGLMPLFSGIFGRTTASVNREGRSLDDALEEKRERRKQSEETIYLFSVSGVVAIALSVSVALFLT